MTILQPDNAGHLLKDLTVFLCKVETVLAFNMAVYRKERDQIPFTKQFLVGDATAA